MRCSLLPKGSVLAFEYHKNEEEGWQPRIGVLEWVRDLEDQPLSSKAIMLRPEMERSRWLYTIHDLARQESRSFYGCRMRGLRCVDLRPVLIVACTQLHSCRA